MQKIDGTTIKLNRGDMLKLALTISQADNTNYNFKVGDKITFSIYEKKKMDGQAVLIKEVTVSEAGETVYINLTSEETKIGDLINKPVEYWYEIELNEEYTVIGYDDDGAKKLMLYPEGSKENE